MARSLIIEHNSEEFSCIEISDNAFGYRIEIREHPRGTLVGEMYDTLLPYDLWDYEDRDEWEEDIDSFKKSLDRFLIKTNYYKKIH
jgi:hypothetical protein